MIKTPTKEKTQHVNTYSNVEFMEQAVRKVTFPRERCGTARPQLEMWKLRQIQSRNTHIDRTRNRSVINCRQNTKPFLQSQIKMADRSNYINRTNRKCLTLGHLIKSEAEIKQSFLQFCAQVTRIKQTVVFTKPTHLNTFCQ